MPWKMNGQQIVMEGSNPVWIGEDGKESGFDAGEVLKRLTEVTGESIGRKTKIREMETQLETLNGIDDPKDFIVKAKKAMATVKNLDQKQLIDAGEVAKVKKELEDQLIEAQKSHSLEVETLKKTITDKAAAIERREVKGFFDQSEFIREKTVLPPAFAYDHFRKNFKSEEKENGEMGFYAERSTGEKIFSKDPKRAGKYATPTEAIEILIDEHPDRDSFMRGGTPGSGTPPGGHFKGNQDLSKLSPIERINAARQVQ